MATTTAPMNAPPASVEGNDEVEAESHVTPGDVPPIINRMDPTNSSNNNINDSNSNDHQPFAMSKESTIPPVVVTTTTTTMKTPTVSGTILEGAFVDRAYSWPPSDGEGRNAIELQASLNLLHEDNDLALEDDVDSVQTAESLRQRMALTPPTKTINTVTSSVSLKQKGGWGCCGRRSTTDAVVVGRGPSSTVSSSKPVKLTADQQLARREYATWKQERHRVKLQRLRQSQRYSRVPEGILIYRLDTTTQTISLMSAPHARTDTTTLVTEMTVVHAAPAPDPSRRGMLLTGADGSTSVLIATEQRTATAWLETMNLMLAKQPLVATEVDTKTKQHKSDWHKERLHDSQLDTIEDEYMNLANYSNKLIRAGALPGGKKGAGGAGGIYYAVEKVKSESPDDAEEEALEAIAKRRAVIKDSWDFYRMVCSLLRDRNKYEEKFQRMQLDPVYPYLNSMTGLNDPGDTGYENHDKEVMQHDSDEYGDMTKIDVARDLVYKAQAALPSLVEICKALAGSLGMEEVGVGPVKEVQAAIRKAEKKYDGDLLKVTDYCRALLVVRDFPSLLALLELARDSFGPLIRRVKLSSLKKDHKPKPGGYRDCIINIELNNHICEIQIHLWPMWTVCGVDGYRHYRHCLEYNTDTFTDPYDALDGLDRKTMAELIVIAEEAVADTPLDSLDWYHEKFILDYFAEAGMFLIHGLEVWAEIIFRHLIRLRIESPDIGPDHHETIILYRYLAQCLRAQHRYDEAKQYMAKVKRHEELKSNEELEAEKSLWNSLMCAPTEAFDMIVDPNRKEREEEEQLKRDVKASKKAWRRVRHERFAFLDGDVETAANGESNRKSDAPQRSDESVTAEEKKVDSEF